MRPKRRHRMRPATRSNLVLRKNSFNISSLDCGIRGRHLTYISRLINAYHLTDNLIEAALSYIDHNDLQVLIDGLYGVASSVDHEEEREDQYYECIAGMHEIDHVSRYLHEDLVKGIFRINEKGFAGKLDSLIKKELRRLPVKTKDELAARIEELAAVFRFSENERQVIASLYSIYEVQTDILEDLLDNLEYNEFLRFISVITGISLKEIKTILSKEGSLYRSGIISDFNHNRRDFIEFEKRISEYLSGIGEISLTERFIKKDRKHTLPVEYFDIPSEAKETVTGLLTDEKPCNILLAGIAGTGKTEFARSISRSTGKPVFTLNVGGSERNRSMSLKHDEENSVYVSFRAAEELVKTADGILIADEMDVMLNRAEKGWLNLFLDSSTAKIIWITNELYAVEESTMRRFHYTQYFEKLTASERIKIWKNILKDSSFKNYIKPAEIKRLAKEYPVNAGGIAHALSNLERIASPSDAKADALIEKLEHLLESHRQQIMKNFNQKRAPLNRIDGAYDPSVLNTGIETGEIRKAVKEFSKDLKTGKVKEGNLNLLFTGAPGTGKTEFVKHLTEVSGLELIVKRYSDLESAYVGETEKNIARAFREAERERSILFIDEADSLFTSRDRAVRSWETSRTNELLTWMENFTGVFICATNRLEDIDSAALRRFQWKVSFKPLVPEKRLSLYKKFFAQAKGRLSMEMAERVKQIDGLTPGDMKAVRERLKFRKETCHGDIIAALEDEQKYKKKGSAEKIGF